MYLLFEGKFEGRDVSRKVRYKKHIAYNSNRRKNGCPKIDLLYYCPIGNVCHIQVTIRSAKHNIAANFYRRSLNSF